MVEMSIVESEYIWMNGSFIKWQEAKVHILTHALHYGSGVFEGIRCYNTERGPAVFRLHDHMTRLYKSAKHYLMNIPFSNEELCEVIVKLIRKNKLGECYIRPLVYRGYGEMGLNPLKNPVDVAITVWPWGLYLGKESLEKGARVKTSSFERISKKALPVKAKACGQYINSILAKIDALNNGYDECIMLDYQGHVSEGAAENIFLVKNNILTTPHDESGIILGITRDSILTISKNLGYVTKKLPVNEEMLYSADETFFTGTAAEIVPIREINNRKIGEGKPGPITLQLCREYGNITNAKNPTYETWLTYVK